MSALQYVLPYGFSLRGRPFRCTGKSVLHSMLRMNPCSSRTEDSETDRALWHGPCRAASVADTKLSEPCPEERCRGGKARVFFRRMRPTSFHEKCGRVRNSLSAKAIPHSSQARRRGAGRRAPSFRVLSPGCGLSPTVRCGASAGYPAAVSFGRRSVRNHSFPQMLSRV